MNRVKATAQGIAALLVGLTTAAALGLMVRVFSWAAGL